MKTVRAAALGAVLTGCMSTRIHSGGAVTSMTSVQMDANEMVVRPAEVRWAVDGKLAYETEVDGSEVEGVFGLAGVFYGGPSGAEELPPVVKLACARAVAESGSDGLLLTHYVLQTNDEDGYVDFKVSLFGRHLKLEGLGVVEAERVDELEGWNDRLRKARDEDAALLMPAADPGPTNE